MHPGELRAQRDEPSRVCREGATVPGAGRVMCTVGGRQGPGRGRNSMVNEKRMVLKPRLVRGQPQPTGNQG